MSRSAMEIGELRASRAFEAFRLRYVEKLKYREIAERMGRVDGSGAVSNERVRQMVATGRRMLMYWKRKDHPLRALAEMEKQKEFEKSVLHPRYSAAKAAYAERHKDDPWFQKSQVRQEQWRKEQIMKIERAKANEYVADA